MKTTARLRVASVEPIGRTMRFFDITTGTGDFIANGVVSHNCYARPTHEYFGLSAGLDFETKIFVKEDAPELLRKELRGQELEAADVLDRRRDGPLSTRRATIEAHAAVPRGARRVPQPVRDRHEKRAW